jgi:hypothetical protein
MKANYLTKDLPQKVHRYCAGQDSLCCNETQILLKSQVMDSIPEEVTELFQFT